MTFKYDHGHAVFEDGFEVEFGFTRPGEDESLADAAENQARDWALDPSDPETEKYRTMRIVSLRLAG
jgi:hypothetical protein